MKVGQPIDIKLSNRYYQFNRSHAMRDVFDALVELITNCDDSYHRLSENRRKHQDGGPVLIEYLGAKDQSRLIIHDRAEGMTLDEMCERLGDVGTRRSSRGDRGFMARGAKDCTELGSMTYESVKNDRYYKCELTTTPQFIPWEKGKRATKEIRARLHIERGNGSVVTFQIDQRNRIPRFDTILRDLPWHFALRDILSEDSPSKVLLKNLNRHNSGREKLSYRNPEAELVIDEHYGVPGYETEARLKIYMSPEAFEDPSERFRRSGLLIKGERAIHECSLLSPEFDRDPLGKKYFGRIECPYIDILLREYDDRRERDEKHPETNPVLLIDPNRQHGLVRDHPFTKSLFLVPSERLRALIAAEREAEKSKSREVATKETKDRLDRLAKRASNYLKQQLDEQELSQGEDVDQNAFKQGTLIFPTYLNVTVSQERTLTYYVNSALLDETKNQHIAVAESEDPALTVVDANFEIRPHRNRTDRFFGTFRVRGEALKDSAIIRVNCNRIPEAQAVASVVESGTQDHAFEQPLEFEHKEYRVREASKKSLEIFAKYPEVVAEPTGVSVLSSDSVAVPIRGTCTLVPVAGSNYATGRVTVQGRKLHAKSQVRASVNNRETDTIVKVVQKPTESGNPIKIELRPEDYGNFRARWADHEGKPNLLLVSAHHKSLSRYLGPEPNFEGQNSAHFRVILAEIVAESVCRKSLTLEAKERTWEFRWADLKDDSEIADTVLAAFHQRFRDFVTDAHRIMLSDSEVRKNAG